MIHSLLSLKSGGAKVEFLRMLVRLQLDPARMKLIAGFFDAYQKLDEYEERQLQVELRNLNPEEANQIMEITTSWHEKGRQEEGRQEGEYQKAIEIAQKLLNKGVSTEEVAEDTGLPVNEVKKLAKNIKGIEIGVVFFKTFINKN